MIKKVLLLYILMLFIISLNNIAFAQEKPPYVKEFKSQISINQDSTLNIKEEIEFIDYFEEEFVRYIPRKYSVVDEEFTYGINEISVSTKNGTEVNTKVSQQSEFAKVSIDTSWLNEENRIILLRYKVDRVFVEKDLHDNFLIRILGNKWEIPIWSTVVTAKSNVELVDASCFSGDIDSGQRLCYSEFDENEARFYSTAHLGQGKDFAVQYATRKGIIDTPSTTTSLLGRFKDFVKIYWLKATITIVVATAGIKLLKKTFYLKRK